MASQIWMQSGGRSAGGRGQAYRLGAAVEDGGAVKALVILYGIAILDDALGTAKRRGRAAVVSGPVSPACRRSGILIRRQCIWVYLDAHGARGVLARADLVQAEHLAGRVVELVMVDLDVGQGGVELDVDVAHPGRKLERGHGGQR